MDKRTRAIAAVFVLTGAAGLVMSTTKGTAPRCGVVQTPTGRSLRVELASDGATRARGLSDRDALAVDGLLLEWPDAGRRPVWMAGMRFSVDLGWLDAQDRVTGVVAHVPLCAGTSCPLVEPASPAPTRAVLEVAAGRAEDLGLVPGASVTHPEALVPCVTPPSPSPLSAHSRAEGGLP